LTVADPKNKNQNGNHDKKKKVRFHFHVKIITNWFDFFKKNLYKLTMKRKSSRIFYIFVVLLMMLSVFKQNVFAQTSDLQSDVIVECVTFTPTNGYGRWPNNVEGGTFTGTCSAKTRCDIVTCLPGAGCVPNTGFVKLSSGNNFFSPGEINEPGQLVNVQDHTGYYLYASHTPESLGKGADGENTTQQQGQATLVFPGGAENCTQIY